MSKRKAKPKSGQGKSGKKPRTAAQYFAQPKRKRESLQKAAHVLSAMRTEGISLHAASREHSVSPRTVLRHAGAALRKTSRGTYAARKSDRLLRVLVLPTADGLAEIATMDSRAATHRRGVLERGELVLGDRRRWRPCAFPRPVDYRRPRQCRAAAYRHRRTGTPGFRGRTFLPIALREGQLMARRSNDPIKAGDASSQTTARRRRGRRVRGLRRCPGRNAGPPQPPETVPQMLRDQERKETYGKPSYCR